jgi:hypothetical protein
MTITTNKSPEFMEDQLKKMSKLIEQQDKWEMALTLAICSICPAFYSDIWSRARDTVDEWNKGKKA